MATSWLSANLMCLNRKRPRRRNLRKNPPFINRVSTFFQYKVPGVPAFPIHDSSSCRPQQLEVLRAETAAIWPQASTPSSFQPPVISLLPGSQTQSERHQTLWCFSKTVIRRAWHRRDSCDRNAAWLWVVSSFFFFFLPSGETSLLAFKAKKPDPPPLWLQLSLKSGLSLRSVLTEDN